MRQLFERWRRPRLATATVRREGGTLDRARFEAVAERVAALHPEVR